MTKENKLLIMRNRLSLLESSSKNIKCPGVVKKLRRQIYNLENK